MCISVIVVIEGWINMRIVQINATTKIGSTGKIMYEINDVLQRNGHKGYMVSAYTIDQNIDNQYCMNKSNYIRNVKKNILISRITGTMGYRYRKETLRMLEWIDSKKPDIIHLHNIHGDWVNLKCLFEYLKNKKIPVVWTLHDCWAFTGRCSHFELCGCNKWMHQCYDCCNKKVYPVTYFFDFSRKMYNDKKNMFTSLSNLTLITPSNWLKEYVEESFLGKYSIDVIHNGIDTSKYIKSDKKVIDSDKKIILGVASSWSSTKGLDDFIELDKMIDHKIYQIVLVGLNKAQCKMVPKTICGIQRTNNEQGLIDIYSSAFVFVNMTYQDNFPTTNLEALACGLPVITYNTGGSPECITEKTGIVVQKGDLNGIVNAIKKVEQIDRNSCRDSAVKFFDKKINFDKYLKLYETIAANNQCVK